MKIVGYNREKAVEYALNWALGRNPNYYDFSNLGGDCTNFASQCLFAGAKIMNYTPLFGWYYLSLQNRTPSWTGVEYFYKFITQNQNVGPFGKRVNLNQLQIGDFIQLRQGEQNYHHTLIITSFDSNDSPLVCAHSNDSKNRKLDTYIFSELRCLHVEGIREKE